MAALPAIVEAAKKRERPRGVSVVLSPRARGLRDSIKVTLDEDAMSPRMARMKEEKNKKKAAAAAAAKEKELAAAKATKCERCGKNDYQLELTVEDCYHLRLCTPCAVTVEEDRVDAAKTVERARGIMLDIADREREKEQKGPFCQR